jgi:hypothetical protein
MIKHGYMNVYRSGYFHRKGKPNTLDRHAGDFYETYEQATKEINPHSAYIATVEFWWDDPEDIEANPSNSIAVPLSVSRKEFELQPA